MGMNRRAFLKALGAGVGLGALRSSSVWGASGSRRPNIVLCMADDQGWGDMAYNGHPVLKTPHFDAMAAEALRFDRFYAAAPVCSPTRASVMTGRHPNRSAVFKWGHALRPQEITVAEALKTGFEEAFGVVIADGALSAEEVSRARELAGEAEVLAEPLVARAG